MLKHFFAQLLLLLLSIFMFSLLYKFGEINIEIGKVIFNSFHICLLLLVLFILAQITFYFKINIILCIFYIQSLLVIIIIVFIIIHLNFYKIKECWLLTDYITIKMFFSKEILSQIFDKNLDLILNYYVNEKMLTNNQVIFIKDFFTKTYFINEDLPSMTMKNFILIEKRSSFLSDPMQVLIFQIQAIIKIHSLFSLDFYYVNYLEKPEYNKVFHIFFWILALSLNFPNIVMEGLSFLIPSIVIPLFFHDKAIIIIDILFHTNMPLIKESFPNVDTDPLDYYFLCRSGIKYLVMVVNMYDIIFRNPKDVVNIILNYAAQNKLQI